ncbi:bifunctional folylpolyglutamate synthase/dihydrofolate synthase [Fusibacter paucivorans]|uniref:tetrahydrofolate synthase n=1 Tax=Fusibacter paucivorans TaxID=76009 RepID=A0ABS5PM21_9FIRM|nr:folylpolyglutamate synthase/dihydrofolate synthase family protein [Fusibacter paucivorans]MBS7526214.1 bifunctional folylpolyglutamate synthase/dihydrofolate synthase [Fusibacter paucivorans]
MTLEAAMAYINQWNYTQMPRGLMRIERLLEALGNPHRALKFIHVAGTNGKGSTVAFISHILQEADYCVGMYTSPGLMRYHERISVNGEEIGDDALIGYVEIIKQAIGSAFENEPYEPNFFEITLAIAMLHYQACGCDFVVLEVGLGGTLDATNVIDAPEVAVIMTIDFDHMAQLGNTLGEIAREKAGIIKMGSAVVVYPQQDEAAAVIDAKCREQQVVKHTVDLQSLKPLGHTLTAQSFNYKAYQALNITMLGNHQIKNAATAIEVTEALRQKGYSISDAAMRDGLMRTKWPARFECVHTEPTVIVDAAHNPEGAALLAANIEQYFPKRRVFFIMGVMADKAYEELVQRVLGVATTFYCITTYSDRALHAEELADCIRSAGGNAVVCKSPVEALERAMTDADNETVICAFGSFYYIGHIRAYFGR